jgi:hypothetical protein
MLKMRNIHFFLLIMMFSACSTQVWVKSGANQSDFQIAKGQCTVASYSAVQITPTQVNIGSGYTSPIYTNCNNVGYSTSCVSSGGNYVPPPTIQYDANAQARNEVFKGCMYGKGWSLAKKEDLMEPSSNQPTQPIETYRYDIQCKIPGQEAIGFLATPKDCEDLGGKILP